MALLAGLLGAFAPMSAGAYTISIDPGTKSIYLVVGTGKMTGGTLDSGGTPGNSSVVNKVSVTVPAASIGSGPLPMTTDSTTSNSLLDGFAYCDVPNEVYVGGYYRAPGNGAGASASLSVTSPANLTSGGQNLSFNSISWTSGGNGANAVTIPSGTFAAGTAQNLIAVSKNYWFEGCLQFFYANASVVPAGTFTGRVTYTLTSP